MYPHVLQTVTASALAAAGRTYDGKLIAREMARYGALAHSPAALPGLNGASPSASTLALSTSGGAAGGSTGAMPLGHSHGHGHGHGPPHHHGGCGTGFILRLLGLDRYTKGKAADGLARASRASNPFNAGIVANCTDFWSKGRELGVEYDRLYDVPMEGFREAKRRRERDEEEDDRTGGRKSRGLFMGLSFGRGNRGGYEPVSQV